MKLVKEMYYLLVFIADEKYNKNPYLAEKIFALVKLILAFVPIAYLLDTINMWFKNNHQFVSGFLVIVGINAWYGIKKHRKLKTFDWKTFFKKTSLMMTLVISVYILLSIVGEFAGDNLVSESFQILVQVMTLFFPASKALKSIFILSDGDYPPKWIMKKVYNFEENGDMHDFFNTRKKADEIEVIDEINETPQQND